MTLPPEALLLRRARQALGLSPGEATKRLRIRMSSRNWYRIENGAYVPHDTLAHMAYAVRVNPDELINIGREEAAEILRRIQRQESPHTAAAMVEHLKKNDRDFARAWASLSPEAQHQALEQAEELERRVEQEEQRSRNDLRTYVEALAAPGQNSGS